MKNFLDWLWKLRLKPQEKSLRNSNYSPIIKRNEELPIEIWTYLVKRRAGFRCEDCGDEELLISHHIIFRPEGKNTLRNGKCVCPEHHGKAHSIPFISEKKDFLGNVLMRACGKRGYVKLMKETKKEAEEIILNRNLQEQKQEELEQRQMGLKIRLASMTKEEINSIKSRIIANYKIQDIPK